MALVYTNDNCIGCNKCIGACSCLGANISSELNGKNRIEVDEKNVLPAVPVLMSVSIRQEALKMIQNDFLKI